MKLALMQLAVGASKAANLAAARSRIAEAAARGAHLVVLPECFNSLYGTAHFARYAEHIPDGESSRMLSEAAKTAGVYVVGGSIPERDSQMAATLYNTCTVWSPTGALMGVHRKVHLFDIHVPGKIQFKESDVLSSGNQITLIDTPLARLGIGICYDVRFPELAMSMARKGAQILIYPGAFNMTTGPLHWELLARARAVDNQVYVAMCSPARDPAAEYVAWGHSLVADPRGQVVAQADQGEDILYCDVDLGAIDEFRQQIPVTSQRRFDLYNDVLKH